MHQRILKMDLPQKKSAFLWGARKTGKSTYLKNEFKQSVFFDLLDTDLFFDFNKRPALLRERIIALDEKFLKLPIIIDEVQKAPLLLEEIHWLIENKGFSFILCGSSARKLKRGQANLLGGRAWRFELFPLTYNEINDFNLLKALNNGLIPEHYDEKNSYRTLKSYVQDYLKEEIFEEGLARNIPAFSKFLDAVGYCQGEMINYSNISRDCGVDSKTIREYFQILVDTLLGVFIEPFSKKINRQVIIKTPKFYLFDVGVASYLQRRMIQEEKGIPFGQAFEHFILMELLSHRSYKELDYKINYYRTKSGYEVDFVLDHGQIAIEVKGSSRIERKNIKGLEEFNKLYKPKKAMVVCNEKEKRQLGDILIIPWREFLEKLWAGEII